MIRLFSFIFVLLVIGFASGYAVFAASTVGEHSPQSSNDPTSVSDDSTAQDDCTKVADGNIKSGTEATGGDSNKGNNATGTAAQ